MSLKSLFGTGFKNYQSASVDVESTTFINQEVIDRETYIPPIDFATASNFVKYGLAEMYYENSISRIYNDYPYDGSKAEIVDFHLSSSYLDRWMYSTKYPKTTGYVELGRTAAYPGYSGSTGYGATTVPEYIRVWGGIHTASSGMEGKLLRNTFDKSGKYDLALNRTQNWRITPASGSTVEFWLKKPSVVKANTEREVILDIWNGETPGTANYARFLLEINCNAGASAGCIELTYQGGTNGFYRQTVSSTDVTLSSLANWHHYSVSVVSASAGGLDVRFYKDGAENLTRLSLGSATAPTEFSGLLTGYLGALQSKTTSGMTYLSPGFGKLSASLDEFRFWKTRRTSREIETNWFEQVGGGANTDDDTTDLGVYFKFNEGITGTGSTDQTVLDYSGRIANGYWQGYASGARHTGSAFVLSDLGITESANPIIYSSHPEVQTLLSEMRTSGSVHDNETANSFYYSLPSWITLDDAEGEQNLKKVSQILSSYFDTLYSQISALSSLQNKTYVESQYTPPPFARELLESKGFLTNDVLINANVLELFANIDKNAIQYEDDITKIKNLIYINIYNNLEAIYKSKGTEKSIRNFIRCFGIDDEIVKLNIYTDGGTHYFTDKSKGTSVNKKYINFNHPDYFSSTLYQTSAPNNDLTFISGSTGSVAPATGSFTFETDVYIPYKRDVNESGFFQTPFLTSSIFGFNEAEERTPLDYTYAGTNKASLNVYLVRDEYNSRNAKFWITNGPGTINWESPWFDNLYNNQHWNVAVRIKMDTYPYIGNVTNVHNTPDGTLDFYAVNSEFGEIRNTASYSTALGHSDAVHYLAAAKRVYAGAHLTNFTGSTVHRSDIQIGAVRAWFDYLTDASILEHNKDPFNYGNHKTVREGNMFLIQNRQIPSQDLTILNWDFDTVTGSDSSGEIIVDDITTGSQDTIYGWVDNIIRREYRGKGINLGASSNAFIENEFLYGQVKELPEISYTNDNVYVKGNKELFFSTDEDVSDNFYLLEKSMNQIISEQMIKLFSTIQEFSNLIGNPVDLYRVNYKQLDKAKQHFFNRVEQDPDLENFLNYYKWIDESISQMIAQLIPASVNFGPEILDVIESHILERNKYQRRIGLLKTVESTEGAARGIREQKYNWRIGHAPISGDPNENCLWQKEKKQRTDIPDREKLREVMYSERDPETKEITLSYPEENGAVIKQTTYTDKQRGIRNFNLPYTYGVAFRDTIHGGINYNKQKDRDFIKTAVSVHGPVGASGAPRNILGIGIGTGDGLIQKQVCDDPKNPNEKVFYDATVAVARFSDASATLPLDESSSYYYRLNSNRVWPSNIVSGSVPEGYSKVVNVGFPYTNLTITNLHSDTTDISNEIPMQGPFTEAFVGGRQNRHVDINRYDPDLTNDTGAPTLNNIDDQYSRPEAWRLLIGENPANPSPDGAMGYVGPDYGGPYPDTTRQWAIYYRGERAKRPLNIQNIHTTTASAKQGNYHHSYEVLSTCGDQHYYLRRHGGNLLPDYLADNLPQTTNYMSLMGVSSFVTGNVWMQANNNRQPVGNGFPGVAATGSFVVTGAYDGGTVATGSFEFYSDQTAGFNDSSIWDGNYIEFGGDKYILDDDGTSDNPSSGLYYFATGSPHPATTWNNLRSKIVSVGIYTASYIQVNSNLNAISLATSHRTTPNPFLSASTNLLDEDEYTWVFNLKLNSTGASSYDEHIFSTVNSAGTPALSQQLYFDTAGGLNYKIHFSSNRIATFTKSNFKSSMGAEDVRTIILSHKYTTSGPNLSDIKIYLDDTLISPTLTSTGGAVPNQQTQRISSDGALYLFSLTGSDNSNFVGTSSVAAAFKDDLGTTQIGYAYNNGYFKDYSNLTSVSPSLLISQWNFDPIANLTNGTVINVFTGSSVLNLTCSAAATEWITGSTGLQREPYAQFSLTSSATGSGKNSAISISASPSTFNYFNAKNNITGATNQGGLFAGNKIAIGSQNFIATTNTSLADTSTNYYIVNTGTSAQIWDSLEHKLITNSTLDLATINRIDSGTEYSTFYLTASITTGDSGDEVITATNAISPASFYSTNDLSGGMRQILWNNLVREIPRTDLTSSRNIIINRFSAPGGVEINSRGYLDITRGEYSVYNNLNYRNLSVRASGSGEHGTLRVDSYLSERHGLETLWRRHCGKGGLLATQPLTDADSGSTNPRPAFYKQARNTHTIPRISEEISVKSILAPSTSTTNNYLELTSTNGYKTIGGLSFSFWIQRATNALQEGTVFQGWTGTNTGTLLQIEATGKIRFFVGIDPSTSATWYTAANTIQKGKWYYVSVAWSGDFSEAPVFYVNSRRVDVDSTTVAGTPSGTARAKNESMYLFDKRGGGVGNELQGSLLRMTIWSKNLSQSDVNDLFENEGIPNDITDSRLLDFWLLGEEASLNGVAIGGSVPHGTIRSAIGNNNLITGNPQALKISDSPLTKKTTVERNIYNNMFVTSLLPSSEFQYSWIMQAVSGSNWLSKQRLRGYAPRSGQISITDLTTGEIGKLVPAIDFPTISDIICESCVDVSVPTITVTVPASGENDSYKKTSDFTITVLNADNAQDGTNQIWANDLQEGEMTWEAAFSACCEEGNQYAITAWKTGDSVPTPTYQDSVPAVPAVTYGVLGDGNNGYLKFWARDCDGDVTTLTITATNGKWS